jgi:thioredoxin 1
VKIAKVNVDSNQQYAAQFGVQGIPMMVLFKEGEQVANLTGLPRNPRETLTNLVSQAL